VAGRHAGWPLTHSDYTRTCINTIILVRMSTLLLETCRGFKKHIIEEIVCQVGYLQEKQKQVLLPGYVCIFYELDLKYLKCQSRKYNFLLWLNWTGTALELHRKVYCNKIIALCVFGAGCSMSWKEHGLTLILLMWRIGWAPNSIPIYS